MIFSTAATSVQAIRGDIKLINPNTAAINFMKRRGGSLKEAQWRTHGLVLCTVVPATAVFTVLFFNGIFGWAPFHIKSEDWLVLIVFSVGTIYLSGALVFVLYMALGNWLLRDIQKLSKWFGQKLKE